MQTPDVPTIGILGWEADNEDTLAQLEQMPGNIANPSTFDFPVLYRRVNGAYYQTVVVHPNPSVLAAMIEAAQELERHGVRAITTSCGFNAIFQQELANSVKIPLFASSLIQVPMVHRMLRRGQRIGIITAEKPHLTGAHLRNAGITPDVPLCVAGIECTGEFLKIRANPAASLDVARFRDEVVGVARELATECQDVGAIVLECTDLPPMAAAIRRATGLPVFDIVTVTIMVHEAITGDRWP